MKNTLEKIETKWDENFKNLTESFETSFEQYFNSFKERMTGQRRDFLVQGEKYLQVLKEYENKAEQVLNIISNTSMAGGYKKVADQEQSSRKFWRTVTMIAMVLLVAASIYSFIHPLGDKSIWTEIAKRVSMQWLR
jgi:hypothetical protein